MEMSMHEVYMEPRAFQRSVLINPENASAVCILDASRRCNIKARLSTSIFKLLFLLETGFNLAVAVFIAPRHSDR
jgi:hypothetical protein